MATPTNPEAKEQWQHQAAVAQSRLAASIPSEWRIPSDKLPPESQKSVIDFAASSGLFSEEELAITEAFATQIVAKIAAGEWSAEKVARAFCKSAAVAHQLTNCLTVTMFDAAIARAKELDAHLAQTGSVVGPLHGLPVSLKDNFNLPGLPSSVGFTGWATEPMAEKSLIPTLLRSLGAVLYVKTNVPTAMMIAETVNNTYGRTLNPLNRALTSGGSSGGESALIAMRGSPLGIGTDIGGSLRIPASCTCIFTLKPSSGRLPHSDARTGLAGQEAVPSVHGPMARSLADCELYTRAILSTEPWLQDAKTLPLPWRTLSPLLNPSNPPNRQLTFAVLSTNDIVTPTPPIQRALILVTSALESQGHTVIPWRPTLHAEAMGLVERFFLADGGTSVSEILSLTSEPWRPEMYPYRDAKELGVHGLWQLQKRRSALQKAYLDRVNASNVDFIISPTTPYAPAPKHGGFRNVAYTAVFNLLDYAAVSFPTGVLADEKVDVYPENWTARNEFDRLCAEDYEPAAGHGLPVSLQLIGRRLEEEKVLLGVEVVLEALEKSQTGVTA